MHVTDVDLAEFESVAVDGVTLPAEDYEVRSGSTVTTLQARFLDTLAPGWHTLTVTFRTLTVTDRFLVEAKAGTALPATGGPSEAGLLVGLNALLVGLALVWLGRRRLTRW